VGFQIDKESLIQPVAQWARVLCVCFICVALAFPCPAQTADSPDSAEYLIKAGFIYNFANLMQWPANTFSSPDSPIVIAIVGTDASGGILDEVLAGKKVAGRPFAVKHLKRGMDLKGCNIVFVSASETAHLDEILHLVKNLPILTIGETPSFAQRGGIINFVVVDDKVRFEVNVEAAKQADISISSRLLALAKIVPQTDGSKVQ
jgi:YfiR/HmsC-like